MGDAEREALLTSSSDEICVAYTLPRVRPVHAALGVSIATIGALLASPAAAYDVVESFVPQGEIPEPSRPEEIDAWEAASQHAREAQDGPARSRQRMPFLQPTAVGGLVPRKLRWVDEREAAALRGSDPQIEAAEWSTEPPHGKRTR